MQPVVQALRDWLDGRPQSVALSSEAVRWARTHRLRGALYHIGAVLSEPDSSACLSAWTGAVARHLTRAQALSRVWPVDAPPPLVYKGADIAENLLDDPGARACVDLDALLPAPYFEPTVAELERQADAVTRPAYERHASERPYAYGFRFGPTLIELHRDPQPTHRNGLRGADVWRRGSPGRLGALAVRYPTPDDRLLLWLSNQAKGAFYGDYTDWLDLALILRRLDGPWARARALSRRVGLERALQLALVRLAESGLWSGPLPRATPPARAVAALLPAIDQAQVQPPPVRFQAIKLWICDAAGRRATLSRGLSTWWRRRPG